MPLLLNDLRPRYPRPRPLTLREEWAALSSADRTLLRIAAQKKNAYARGFTKAGWKRLPMAEKFAILRGAR